MVDEADFVSQQNIPSSMAAGTTATVSVTFKNTGATTWTAGAGYKLGFTNPYDENVWGTSPSWPGRVLLASGESISPCQSKTFAFTIRAPATAGAYNFQWRMLQEAVQWFGHWTPNVVIDVTGSAPDGDGDGVSDSNDNCPTDANDDQHDGDSDGLGNACDTDMPSDADAFDTWEEQVSYYSTDGSTAPVRCKVQKWVQEWTYVTIPVVNYRELALRYEGMFRVCYRHNAGIVSISDIHGDETETGGPWEWFGNDPGYPYGVKYADRAEFFYKGSMAICIFKYGCGPTKHPWEKVTFWDNNTITRTGGVT